MDALPEISTLTHAQKNENPLFISWHDSNWIPMLNPSNILDYFSERSNPFYDRTCNNEVIKMQRLSQDQLRLLSALQIGSPEDMILSKSSNSGSNSNMTGVEYVLLHAQEPILYIVRKQHRHSPQQVTPLADYYIIAGIVYQAPDLCSVINSRLLNAVYNLQTAFEEVKENIYGNLWREREFDWMKTCNWNLHQVTYKNPSHYNAHSYARYHPSRGYWWEFHDKEDSDKSDVKEKKKEEPSSIFQRQRVDLLLGELAKKFPPKFVAPSQPEAREEQVKVEPKQEVKQEKADDKSNTSSVKPPPEKKPKLIR